MAIKVLHLTSTPRGIGGVERLLLDMSGRFDPRRFEVGYCNLFGEDGGNGVFPAGLRSRGVPVYDIPGTGWGALPAIVARLVALLRRERVELLHTHMLHATIVGLAAARLAGVSTTLVTRHYTDEGYEKHAAWMRALDLSLLRGATHVAGVSRSVSQYLLREARIPAVDVSVVPNGIDLGSIEAGRRGAAATGEFLVGTVGSLNPRKGHADLLTAMAEVVRHSPGARVMIIGEGSERPALEALAARLGVADRVSLPGFRSDVAQWLPRFDLYVQPSRSEPFGISILEAMAARRAVVATSVGGIPDIVVEGETGLLVPPSDPEALGRAILRVAEDPARAREMGERGRQRVEEQFTIGTVVRNYERLYTRLVRGSA